VFTITMGSGPDVVLLHGSPSSTYTWRSVIEPLARGHRVHAIDLPGYGFSDKPAGAPYDAAWEAANVVAYMDAAGIQRATLVGNSMGGHVAAEVAITHPDRVAALVLIAAAGLPPAHAKAPPLSLRMLGWPIIGPVLRSLPARGRVRDGLREAVYDPETISDADVDAYYAPLRSAGGTNGLLGYMEAPLPPDQTHRVQRITAPTLIITGDTDRLVPMDTAKEYHELIGGSEILVLGKTGHLPQEERPVRVVEEVSGWIDVHP